MAIVRAPLKRSVCHAPVRKAPAARTAAAPCFDWHPETFDGIASYLDLKGEGG
jgi:hypothetical protein